jgi:hypothetical protein
VAIDLVNDRSNLFDVLFVFGTADERLQKFEHDVTAIGDRMGQ